MIEKRCVSMEGRQTLKIVLALWSDATELYSAEDFDGTIEKFLQVEDLSARMLYNMACAYIRLDKMTLALQCLSVAVKKDEHLAIAYFQKGVLNLKLNSLTSAIGDFVRAKTLMRANSFIDYKPLGMAVKLRKFEILYNLALAYLHDNHTNEAESLFTEALHDADVRQRKLMINLIEHVQEKRHSHIPPIEIPIDRVFTPPKMVVDNLTKKHVMESAKVVMAADKDDTDPSFNGKKRLAQLLRQQNTQGMPKTRKPQSPLLKMKRFLFSQSNVPKQNSPSCGKMRAAHSTGDIRNLQNMSGKGIDILHSFSPTNVKGHQFSKSCDGKLPMSRIVLSTSSSSLEDDAFSSGTDSPNGSLRILQSTSVDEVRVTPDLDKIHNQNSIEEACTTSATCIARALSSNCDVTIVVTPPAIDLKELSDVLLTELKNKDRTSKDSTDFLPKNKNKCNFYVDTESDKINNETEFCTIKDVQKLCQTPDNTVMSPRTCRKPRPPPPSYPPPALPSKFVFNV